MGRNYYYLFIICFLCWQLHEGNGQFSPNARNFVETDCLEEFFEAKKKFLYAPTMNKQYKCIATGYCTLMYLQLPKCNITEALPERLQLGELYEVRYGEVWRPHRLPLPPALQHELLKLEAVGGSVEEGRGGGQGRVQPCRVRDSKIRKVFRVGNVALFCSLILLSFQLMRIFSSTVIEKVYKNYLKMEKYCKKKLGNKTVVFVNLYT